MRERGGRVRERGREREREMKKETRVEAMDVLKLM
jgi:hypothetical protein